MNMKKLGRILIAVYEGIGAAAMGLLAVLVIFTVIMRYCFSLNWKELSEFNVTLFAFTTFWALGLNVLREEHVTITILYDMLPALIKKVFSLISCAVMFIVDWQFINYGWTYTMKMGKQISQGMEIPMKYMYGIMPVCGVICLVCIIIKFIEHVLRPTSSYQKLKETASPLE